MDTSNNPGLNEYCLKFKYLLDNYRKPNGDRYAFSEIEKGTGGVVRYMWCWKMDKGQIESPGQRNLTLLAEFLGVKPGFWDYDLEQWKAQQTEVKKVLDISFENAKRISARSMELNIRDQELILELIDAMKRKENVI